MKSALSIVFGVAAVAFGPLALASVGQGVYGVNQQHRIHPRLDLHGMPAAATTRRMPPARVSDRHQVIIPRDLMRRVDDWRRKQSDIPNKSEAIRRLLEKALEQPEATRKSAPKGTGRG